MMNDEDTLLAFPSLYRQADARTILCTIRCTPQDDNARLVFADWLDEHAHLDPKYSDHYAARCEFIRAGCYRPGAALARQCRMESEWLDTAGNWERLFPTLCSMHKPDKDRPPSPQCSARSGRIIRVRLYCGLPEPARTYIGFCAIHLRRGFAVKLDFTWRTPWSRLIPAIAKDDPLVPCVYPSIYQAQAGGSGFKVPIRMIDVTKEVFDRMVGMELTTGESRRKYAQKIIVEHDDRDVVMARAFALVDAASRGWAEQAPIWTHSVAKA